jgi:hypothetical protein
LQKAQTAELCGRPTFDKILLFYGGEMQIDAGEYRTGAETLPTLQRH